MDMKVTLFALSTCGWCKATREFLEKNNLEPEVILVDLLEGEEKENARAELARFNPRRTYPTTVINDEHVVTGFDEEKFMEILNP